MKRYEERLLEDMQSREWRILLGQCPPIYGLPNELLHLIFGLIDGVKTLRSVRSVSRRFRQLASALMFKIIYMNAIKPSRMTLLPWALKGNPTLLHASDSLHLRICGSLLTLHYPSRIPTTRDQDIAQAEVISSMPRLRTLSISLGLMFPIIYPNPVAKSPMGFSRTLEALSKAVNLRELCLQATATRHDGSSNFFLLDVLMKVGERLEKLTIEREILIRVLSLIHETYEGGDNDRFPKLRSLTHLFLDLHYLTNQEFTRMSVMLSHHLPNLTKLECRSSEPGNWWSTEEDTAALVMIDPIETLIIKDCMSVRMWMVSIPARMVELEFHLCHTCAIIAKLADLILSRVGVFSSRSVERIKLKIDTTPMDFPIYDFHPIYATQNAAPRKFEEYSPEGALQLLKDVCTKRKIVLMTSWPPGGG